MIRIAVCDDDMQFITNIMKPLLSKAMQLAEIQAEVRFYNNGQNLLESFKKNEVFDIVILDIDMPIINGKELAEQLRLIDSVFTLAFMTAFKEEVYDTIPLGISAFIPKEFDNEKNLSSLIKLFKNHSKKNTSYEFVSVLVNGNKVMRKFSINNIYYFQSVGGNIVLHTCSEQFFLTERIFDKIAQEYTSKGFYRTHRNYLVNIGKTFEVMEHEVVMSNNVHLSLSKRNRKCLLTEIAGKVAERVVQ